MNVNQYLMINLEIVKDVVFNETTTAAVKFGLNLPHGVPWADAQQACDDFKAALVQMQQQQAEALAAQQAPVEPEIVS
jgi:hypothetical protein